jgi:hypothetical protein
MNIPALISIDCHECDEHVFVPVTIVNRGEVIGNGGIEQTTFTVQAAELRQQLIRHMDEDHA